MNCIPMLNITDFRLAFKVRYLVFKNSQSLNSIFQNLKIEPRKGGGGDNVVKATRKENTTAKIVVVNVKRNINDHITRLECRRK